MRSKALIRRSKLLSDTAFVLNFGPLRYAVATQLVTVHGQEVKLSRKSLMTLELLMRYAGRVVPRQKLEDYLWQGDPPSAEALRSQLHLLRKALHPYGYDGIETVHGIGWRLID
jgi:DNA-binding response OmpR family regulator